MGACVASQQFPQRIGARLQEDGGKPVRQHHTQRIAQPRGVFHRRPARAAGEQQREGALFALQCGQVRRCVRGIGQSQCGVGFTQWTQLAQQVGQPFLAARLPLRCQSLQLTLDLFHHGRVQQFAQIHLAEQLA